nr:hypothetical protein [Tanacetum cinerariifolium]
MNTKNNQPSPRLGKEREKGRDKEYEELKAKCEVVMADFNKNPAVNASYQVSLLTLESKVASLETKKVKLEATEASPHQELENARLDRTEVISKVVPYVAIELVQSDNMGRFVAKLVSFAIFYERCHAFEEVANMKEPFDITKKPHVLQRPVLTRTHMPASSAPSKKASPSPAMMFPPLQITPATALATSLPSASFLLSFESCPLLTGVRLVGSYVPKVPGLGHPPILAEIRLAASRCGSLSPHALL